MRNYTPADPQFQNTIPITETSDPAHADNINAAPKVLIGNDVALHERVEEVARAAGAAGVPEYDPERGYAVGEYCSHENVMYRCTAAVTAGAEWDASSWEATSVSEELNGAKSMAQAASVGNALPYSSTQTYAAGDYCSRGGKMYRCTTAIAAPEEWTAAHWQETTVSDGLSAASAAAAAAQEAADKANEAIESGEVGGGNTLRITFAPEFEGAEFTVTDGASETKTGTVPASLTADVHVSGSNTEYTISAAAGGVTYSNSVTTGQYYGQIQAQLNVFSATITVTTSPEAEVTATLGASAYTATASSSGIATVVVKRSGLFTISATKGEINSNTAQVDVQTDGGSYTAAVSFIVLTLTTPAGCSVSLTDGVSTYTEASSTGTRTYFLPRTGTWTCTINNGEETATGSVIVAAYQAYCLDVAFVHIYGVQWDGTSTTRLTRTDEADLFTDPVPAVNNGNGSSPFDDKMPWSGMTRVTDAAAGELVRIPKFWFKWTKSGNTLKLQIADRATSGFHVSPAHADRGDGKGERSEVFVGRYHCSSGNWKSATGVKPKVNITRDTARGTSGIHGLGTDIWQFDMAMRVTIQMLYLVEFADWNSQAKIGGGCSETTATSSAVFNTGKTDSMTYHTGTVSNTHSAYGVCQYRNIEGLWDNCYDWMDGCYYTNNGLNVITNPANFSDTTGGTLVGLPSSGYPSALAVATASGFEWVFYPTAASGSDSTYVPDSWSFSGSSPCLRCGGDCGQDQYHGLFCVSYSAAANSSASIGCRLQKLP